MELGFTVYDKQLLSCNNNNLILIFNVSGGKKPISPRGRAFSIPANVCLFKASWPNPARGELQAKLIKAAII